MVLRLHYIFIEIYIYIGNIELAKAEENQEQFKSYLNEIIRGNPKKKSKHQVETTENTENLYESREKVIKLYNDYPKIRSEAKHKSKYRKGLKILTFKQMLQRLPISLAQIEAVNNSETLLNEIRQIVYSLYQSKKNY